MTSLEGGQVFFGRENGCSVAVSRQSAAVFLVGRASPRDGSFLLQAAIRKNAAEWESSLWRSAETPQSGWATLLSPFEIRRSMFNVRCFSPLQKTISPRPAFRSNGDKWGMGVRQALFPMPTLGAHPCGGCQLPDAILHGKRSLRPRGRAVQHLAAAEFRVRLFSLLELMVAPPACKPDEDTSVICSSRLHHLAPGQPPLLAARSPEATGLASSLSGCFSLTAQRCRF